jgi:hypothetical protein
MLDQHNAGRVRSLHSSQRKHPHTRSLSLSLSLSLAVPCSLERKTRTLTKSSALGGYLSFLITTGSYSEASQTRELRVPEKNQNWRIAGSSYFKTLKPPGFMKEPAKDRHDCGW